MIFSLIDVDVKVDALSKMQVAFEGGIEVKKASFNKYQDVMKFEHDRSMIQMVCSVS